VGTAWWTSCPSSGDVRRYGDSLSGQWIGRNGPITLSHSCQPLRVGQSKEHSLRSRTKHAGPAAELHWKDENTQHVWRLSAD
jgi:hypothetical protein